MRAIPDHAGRYGFTLIEVLVSLAIAAIGMALFLSATGMGLQNNAIADQYIQATRLAQSHLATVGLSLPLRPGVRSGDDEGGFRWQIRISAPLAQARSREEQSSSPMLYPVEVDESWQSGFSRREIALRSERLGAQ